MSALCALFAIAIPPGWIALLGLAPLLLGIRGLVRLRRSSSEAQEEPEEKRARSVGSPVLAVAGVTIANGGDNLGVYIPMFASAPRLIPLYATLFTVMTGLWCLVGYYLVNNPLLGKRLARYGTSGPADRADCAGLVDPRRSAGTAPRAVTSAFTF